MVIRIPVAHGAPLDALLVALSVFVTSGGNAMPTYSCPSCEMTVNATCGACDAPLVNDVLTKDDGSTVQVSKCPNGHGKIKSPMCCGADMSCSVA